MLGNSSASKLRLQPHFFVVGFVLQLRFLGIELRSSYVQDEHFTG